MYKLIILIEQLEDQMKFESEWHRFLHTAEEMPGLIKETTSWVNNLLYGRYQVKRVHEMFFNTMEDLSLAMASPAGLASGKILQEITSGRFTLLTANHAEDSIENIQEYVRTKPEETDSD